MPLISLLIAAIFYVFMIVMNFLANSLPLGGINTGQVSFNYPNLFQPSGFTFSIWGIIYLLLGAYLVYQFQIFFGSGISSVDRNINILFGISSILNVLWLFSWHYQRIGLSTIIMILLLITLGYIVLVFPNVSVISRIAFSVYFGWISVATIANITIYLVKLGFPSDQIISIILTVIVLIVGLLIGLLMIFLKRNISFGLVFIWAYFGILMRHLSKSEFDYRYPLITMTTIISLVILLSGIIYTVLKE